jgi:hypothetical protein
MKKNNMNKQDAILAMQMGNKVTHQYFTSDEWMTMDGIGRIVFEDKVSMPLHEFFNDRQGAGWEGGYTLFNDEQNVQEL